MILRQLKYRSDDDDYAPLDYSFVSSQAEGHRRRQAEAIHRDPQDAVVRHRAEPGVRTIDAYGTHARRPLEQPAPEPVRRGLPSLLGGPAPAQRIAYPQEREPEASQEEAPPLDGSFQTPPQEAFPQKISPEVAPSPPPQAAPEPPPEGPLFDAPAPPEIPEWLRIANQNNMPLADRPARRPSVIPAPRQEEPQPQRDLLGRPLRSPRAPGRESPPSPDLSVDYREAGYPPELLQQHILGAQEARPQQPGGQRHGARHAVRFQQPGDQPQGQAPVAPVAPLPSSYPPARPELGGSRRREEREAFPSPGGPQGEPPWQGYGPQGYGPGGHAPPQPAGYDREPPQDYAQGYAQDYAQGYAPRGYAVENAPLDAPLESPYAAAPQGYAPQWPQASPPGPGYGPAAYDPYGQPQSHAPRTRQARPQAERDEVYAQEEARARPSIPWLGIAASVMALLAVALWILQMSFATQTQRVLHQRQEAAAAIQEKHPFRYRELIETQAQVHNLHPAFIAAIVLNESSFNPQAESSVGARGLMQMMPDTAQWVHGKIAEDEEYSFDSMYDPGTNVRYACWYVEFLSERFRGDPVLVAAAFHAGQGTVQKWLDDPRYSADSLTIDLRDMMDGPTKNYASRVLAAYAAYKRIYYEDQGIS